MATAVAKVEAEHGAVGALVNSAGYAMSGCIEEASMAEVREQFETNVYGLVRLSQLVLPGMRAHGGCTIVNIPSISGRYAVPGSGFYNATKHAVEALSDALRNEVADFGVRVVLVEPGPVRTTRFGATYVANLRPVSRTYETFRRESAEYFEAIYTGSRRTLAGSFAIQPDDVARRVARVVAKGVRGGRARARYPAGQSPPTRRAIKERPRMAYLPFGSGPVTACERGTAAPRPSRRTAPAESAACPHRP